MKASKFLKIIILSILIFFLGSSLYNYTINTFLLKTKLPEEDILITGHQTTGLILREETLVKAPASGSYDIIVSEGQRVARNESLAIRMGQPVQSPASGLVSFIIDGFEEMDSSIDSLELDLSKGKEEYHTEKTTGNLVFDAKQPLMKVIDNLSKPKIYMEAPLALFEEPLKIGMVLRISFDDNSDIYRVRITDLKGIAQQAMILAEFVNYPKESQRFQPLTIITDEKKVSRIPAKSVVYTETGAGVFVVERGFIVFHEISLIKAKERDVYINSLEGITEIIINPRFAKEGRFIR